MGSTPPQPPSPNPQVNHGRSFGCHLAQGLTESAQSTGKCVLQTSTHVEERPASHFSPHDADLGLFQRSELFKLGAPRPSLRVCALPASGDREAPAPGTEGGPGEWSAGPSGHDPVVGIGEAQTPGRGPPGPAPAPTPLQRREPRPREARHSGRTLLAWVRRRAAGAPGAQGARSGAGRGRGTLCLNHTATAGPGAAGAGPARRRPRPAVLVGGARRSPSPGHRPPRRPTRPRSRSSPRPLWRPARAPPSSPVSAREQSACARRGRRASARAVPRPRLPRPRAWARGRGGAQRATA